MDTNRLLEGKVIVVTGGTKGLGRALAYSCADQGSRVVIGGRAEQDGAEIVGEINKLHGAGFDGGEAAVFVKGDVSRPESCRDLIHAAVSRFGMITGLVNYAGILPSRDLLTMDQEIFDQVYAVNVRGPFFTSKYAVEAMQRTGGGSIVNVGSIHAYGGEIDRPAYACSKGALLTLTKHIAKNYAKDQIRCNWVSMGWVATPGEMALRTSQGRDLAWLENIAADSIPLGRLLTEDDHLMGVMYLLSDYSTMVTGTELQNAGGFMP